MDSLREHPEFDRLLGELGPLVPDLARPWEGRVYRSIDLKWAMPADLISGKGSRQYGCRWMQPRIERVVHAATTESIALKEGRGRIDYYSIKRPLLEPRVTVEITVRFGKIVSLSQFLAAIRRLSLDDFLIEDWRKVNRTGSETLSQAFGRALATLDCEGLMAPSALDRRGRTLFWLPSKLSPGCQVTVSGRKNLERWLAK